MKFFQGLGLFLFGLMTLSLAGCATPSGPVLDVDISDIDCDNIDEGRTRVSEGYVKAIGDARSDYEKAISDFSSDLEQCLDGIWDGGPCDDQWNALQQAYATAMGDISNDDAYNNYKAKKADRDACYGSRDENYADRERDNKADEQNCKDIHDTMREAAENKFQETLKAAEKERDDLLRQLDKLEEDCQDVEDDGNNVAVDSSGVEEGCDGGEYTIPGANGTPRRGSARDLGAEDAALTALITLAEGVTGTPVPVGAINDQIFAGIVCVKLRSRIAEILMEEIDAVASGNRRAEIAARKKLADYRRAMRVWCAIAEGRPPVQFQTEVSQLQDASFGSCDAGEEAFANVVDDTAIEVVESNDGYQLPVNELAAVSIPGDRDGDVHFHAKDNVSVKSVDGRVLSNYEVCQKNISDKAPTKMVAPHNDMKIEVDMGM